MDVIRMEDRLMNGRLGVKGDWVGGWIDICKWVDE